jgi:hypothetical protein
MQEVSWFGLLSPCQGNASFRAKRLNTERNEPITLHRLTETLSPVQTINFYHVGYSYEVQMHEWVEIVLNRIIAHTIRILSQQEQGQNQLTMIVVNLLS